MFARPTVLIRLLVTLLLLGTCAASAAAQAGWGAIEGTAQGAEGAAPLAFSLIRLLPARPQASPTQTVLTDARGRFRFDGVPAGDYRLRLERVGYERTLSPVLSVAPDATVRHELRSTAEPIRLAGLTVGGRCLGAGELEENPRVAALWSEAQKGVETRRAFERQYRFTEIMRQVIMNHWRFKRTRPEIRVDSLVSDPDSVAVRGQRRRARFAAQGYSRGGNLSLPNETELLDREFLREHCLETAVDEADGAFALRFRPTGARRGRSDIRGAIWIDASTYLIRRLEVEYVDGERSIGQASVEYADMPMAGSRLRMRSRGQATVRPGGVGRVLVSSAEATISFAYDDVEQVGSR